ncbi:2-amino-4-hydroxy-6-hydroxymethyldihydropteridine diphosphokinase [Echinicola sediminis]
MEQVVLLIGGNMGDREGLMEQALEKLGKHFDLTKKSALYETEAWGGESSGNYLNRALVVETAHSPMQVLDLCQKVEKELGRKRDRKWGDRTMDIDIIFYGDRVIRTDRLKVPHPLMGERRFVLLPIVEILPDFVHPLLQKDMKGMLTDCLDPSKVQLYSPSK